MTQAAKAAGYSDKNPAQSGYQALAQLRGRVPELLERHGLGEEVLIEKYLLPLLDAEETKFFNGGKKRINVQALGIRLAALRTAFELHGSYAPEIQKRPQRMVCELLMSIFRGQQTSGNNLWIKFPNPHSRATV